MKIPYKRGFTLVTIYSTPSGDEGRRHQVELWEQPLHLWLLAMVYHWYDMRIYKVPGFRLLEQWLTNRHHGNPLEYLPLGVRQDLGCYWLTEKQRTVLAALPIDHETYERLKEK